MRWTSAIESMDPALDRRCGVCQCMPCSLQRVVSPQECSSGFIAISPVMTREDMWRKYTFYGAAPPHGSRERKGTPSVEAPLLTLLSRLQASEALVFTLSSQQHPGASPKSTSLADHAYHMSVSLFLVGGRDSSLYPGALGRADLADKTRVARGFKCLWTFTCSLFRLCSSPLVVRTLYAAISNDSQATCPSKEPSRCGSVQTAVA
jgi:hypothetical protein